jgi:alpha-L-fucosidase 2
MQDKRIWTDKPLMLTDEERENPRKEAGRWELEAYPIGNGRLGCTAFGDPSCERIQFNQDAFWVGNECNTGAYQPFGDVHVQFNHGEYTDYSRALDVGKAVQTISYQADGVTYKRECFASHPSQVIVVRFTSDTSAALSGKISMSNVHDIPVSVEQDSIAMVGDTSNLWYWRMLLENPDRLLADREYTSDQCIALDFEARVKILHAGGEIAADGASISFSHCDSLTLVLAAETNYIADRSKGWREGNPSEKVKSILERAISLSYQDLLTEHIADYQTIYGRMSLELGEVDDTFAKLKTSERLVRYRTAMAQGQVPDDRGLESLLYHYARYLMISSSRPGHGALPTNLQGIWCIYRKPPWRCDFHTDINIQMNYWFTSASNLADCFAPFANWVDSIRDVRKEETRKVLGVERGWLMRSENGIFGGSTWHIQKGDSAWICQNLWDHYTFTLDQQYLAERAYPVMKEISEFWLDHLKELPDGTLVVPEGRSPEHGPVGVDGVTYDQQLCWDLFNNTVQASALLHVDEDLRAELINKRDRLLQPQVGRWGQLQEWMEDIDDPDDDHRHINHLIGVYPGYHINKEKNAELALAARVSLLARQKCGAEHPGWSKAWKACMFARLHDSDMAYRELSEIISTKIYDNLWATHPPFQIDCNFGYAAGVNEMLIQSHTGQIVLLPALPKAWPDGRVKGLRVRGGYEVDMVWSNGRLVSVIIRNASGSSDPITISYGEKSTSVSIPNGGSRDVYAAL